MLALRLPRFSLRRSSSASVPVWQFCYENVLGTSLEIRVQTGSEAEANAAEQRALAEIDRLEAIFSSFNPVSEFCRWQTAQEEPKRLSPELVTVLRACEDWQVRSRGAFHPASGEFSLLWREAARRGVLPDKEQAAMVQSRLRQPCWRWEAEPDTATCLTDVPLTLNAIAKGYIVDAAMKAALASKQVRGVLVNIGGDLSVGGELSETVGIEGPNQDADNVLPDTIVRLQNAALATSGDHRRGFVINGTRYSHIVDPRTGWPVSGVRNASVIASTAAAADALATIISVLPPAESLILIETIPGAGCRIVEATGRTHRNRQWLRFEL